MKGRNQRGEIPPQTKIPKENIIEGSKAKRSLIRFILILLGISSIFALPTQVEAVKLNAPLANGEQVIEFLLDEGGKRVVYKTKQISNDGTITSHHLYSAALNGFANPVQLDILPQTPNSRITSFKITSDGRMVIYVAYPGTDFSKSDLYCVPITGGDSIKLNSHPGVYNFLFTHDGQSVVYWGVSEGNSTSLFTVPTSGGKFAHNITGSLSCRWNSNCLEGIHLRYLVSRDDQRVFYLPSGPHNPNIELFSVSLSGETPVQHIPPNFGNNIPNFHNNILDFQVSPNSQWIVFHTGFPPEPDFGKLFSVSRHKGSPVIRLSPSNVSGYYFISNDSKKVFFREGGINHPSNLFSIPIEGGAAIRLNDQLWSRKNSGIVKDFRLSPNNTTAVYIEGPGGQGPLKSVAISSKITTVLDGEYAPVIPNPDRFSPVFTPDSQHILYERVGFTSSDLFSVPATGGTPIKLSDSSNGKGYVFDHLVNSTSQYVVYVADRSGDGGRELYSIPLSGGTRLKLNDVLVSGGDVRGPSQYFAITPDNRQVVYLADQDTDEVLELYRVPLHVKPTTPIKPPDRTCFSIDKSLLPKWWPLRELVNTGSSPPYWESFKKATLPLAGYASASKPNKSSTDLVQHLQEVVLKQVPIGTFFNQDLKNDFLNYLTSTTTSTNPKLSSEILSSTMYVRAFNGMSLDKWIPKFQPIVRKQDNKSEMDFDGLVRLKSQDKKAMNKITLSIKQDSLVFPQNSIISASWPNMTYYLQGSAAQMPEGSELFFTTKHLRFPYWNTVPRVLQFLKGCLLDITISTNIGDRTVIAKPASGPWKFVIVGKRNK